MKYLVKSSTAIAFIFILILVSSCSKSKDATDLVTPATTSGVTTSIITGKWAVSSYMQKTEDKSQQLTGYVFTFTSTGPNAGAVTALKDNSTINGTWTHQAAVTYYGSSSSESFTLNFGSSAALIKLNKIWNVASLSGNQLSLASPEVAEDEHLTFVKQ